MKTEQEYLAELINEKLRSTVIKNACIDPTGELVGLEVVRKGKGRGNYDVFPVWILRDPEGNGSGWLEIEDDH